MGSARTNQDHTALAGDPDQAIRHHRGASKLFENDHAYAARLVQIAIATGIVRSATTTNVPDQVVTEFQDDDGITVGIAGQPRQRRDDP